MRQKKKISEKLKGRKLSEEHINKLRKCMEFEEFEKNIKRILLENSIKTITMYRDFVRKNSDLRYPVRPEVSYKNLGWTSWREYGL